LAQGKYHFRIRATLPTGLAEETSYDFEKLPVFYETISFQLSSVILLAAGAFGLYFLRVRQLRYRFALVLDERARLAREIHDTLTQGFVGISSQLEGVDLALSVDLKQARQHLRLARRMARHSITEARRSVRDLRASVLEGRNLGAALRAGGEMWTAHAGIAVSVEVSGAQRALPEELEQHLLRIAQEAVTNSCKHGAPNRISIHLSMDKRKLAMRIADDGQGFDSSEAFSSSDGHFGLVGMRERAERLGGELLLSSECGRGTTIDVSVPLP
jgi:signal transduction histidine kinase